MRKLFILVLVILLGLSARGMAAYTPPTGSSGTGQILWNNTFHPNSVGGLVIGNGLVLTTTNGVTTLSAVGGGIPVTAIVEETGTPILGETGSYIVEE